MNRFFVFLISVWMTSPVLANQKKKILFINSYHSGYEWSDGMIEGAKKVLEGRNDVTLVVHEMDTKRHNRPEDLKKATEVALERIEKEKPDGIIAADDNANKFVIAPYIKGKDLPVVFCGVNYTAGQYGYPAKNVTGLIEVSPINLIMRYFGELGSQPLENAKIGYLDEDTLSGRKNAKNVARYSSVPFVTRYASTFAQWKEHFRQLNQSVDYLILGANSIEGWDNAEAEKFVLENTKIIVAGFDHWMVPYTLYAFVKDPAEHGEWATKKLLEVLYGVKKISDIPIDRNKRGRVMLNMKIAKKIGVKIPYQLVLESVKTIK